MDNKDILTIDDNRKEEMLKMSGKDFVDEVTKILAAIRQETRKIAEEVKEGTEEEKKEFKNFLENALKIFDKMKWEN